ncbi:hypothetical protein Scep_017915 [Stephania cephalantha]|uniref:RRM domain-containing protein n=1 Tax=Stephania cephalantha TaxID=152367 RepID=A0AAP0ISB1_9MAGN
MTIEASIDGDANEFKASESTEEEKFQGHTGDGASPGKIFVGGLAKETTPVQFTKHFGKYGEITDSVIMKDRRSGQPRGFGFITYADPSVVDKVIQDDHIINGKQVEIKRTIPKGASMNSKDFKTKKIFVGGIPTTLGEGEFKEFFSKFGEVKEHMIMRDHASSRSRGFGFITFDSDEAVDDLLSKGNRIELAGAQVEIKKAEPKKANPPPKRSGDSRPSYGGGHGDPYGGYGGSSFGGSSYRFEGGFGSRPGAYGGYGASEYGSGYGGYGGGSSLGGYGGSGVGGGYRGESSFGYSGRYGGGYGRGYDVGGGYGGAGEGYGGYGSGAGGYGSGYDTGLGSGGYGNGAGGPLYGNRGAYGGGAAGSRYHPYGR